MDWKGGLATARARLRDGNTSLHPTVVELARKHVNASHRHARGITELAPARRGTLKGRWPNTLAFHRQVRARRGRTRSYGCDCREARKGTELFVNSFLELRPCLRLGLNANAWSLSLLTQKGVRGFVGLGIFLGPALSMALLLVPTASVRSSTGRRSNHPVPFCARIRHYRTPPQRLECAVERRHENPSRTSRPHHAISVPSFKNSAQIPRRLHILAQNLGQQDIVQGLADNRSCDLI